MPSLITIPPSVANVEGLVNVSSSPIFLFVNVAEPASVTTSFPWLVFPINTPEESCCSTKLLNAEIVRSLFPSVNTLDVVNPPASLKFNCPFTETVSVVAFAANTAPVEPTENVSVIVTSFGRPTVTFPFPSSDT